MATVDVPLYWGSNRSPPRFTTRQRSLSMTSGLSSSGTARVVAARRPKLSSLYDFRRSYSLRKKDQSLFEVLRSQVHIITYYCLSTVAVVNKIEQQK